jgi:hypothetical protein
MKQGRAVTTHESHVMEPVGLLAVAKVPSSGGKQRPAYFIASHLL